MKQYLFAFILAFFALPVHAIDVSVVDGRAQVGPTISNLTAKLNLLNDVVTINAEQLTIASQKLAAIDNCAQNDMLYKEGTGCVAPPPDLTEIANLLNCNEGEVIKHVGGELVCSLDTLSQCQVCTDTERYTETHRLSGFMATWPDINQMKVTLLSRVPNNIITTTCADIVPGTGVDLDVNYATTKKYISGYWYTGQHKCGGYSQIVMI